MLIGVMVVELRVICRCRVSPDARKTRPTVRGAVQIRTSDEDGVGIVGLDLYDLILAALRAEGCIAVDALVVGDR